MITPPGRGGIAVIRVCGSHAGEMVNTVFSNAAGIRAGELRFGKIISEGNVVDEAILACVNCCEFEINIHGGSAVGRLTLAALLAAGGQINANRETSDFSSRHPDFDNPSIGREMQELLPRIAGGFVLGVITSQWSGGLSALLCGELDADDLRAAAGRFEAVRRLLDLPEVVIAGRPNAGKSTLTNALIGREVSIVHSMAGTTRDWVRELAILHGRPVWLTDTAGLWDAAGLHDVDSQAVTRAWRQIRCADLVILASCGDETIEMPAEINPARVLKISTKADECPPVANGGLAVSAVTGDGLAELKTQILSRLGTDKIAPGLPAAFTSRQRNLLIEIADALDTGNLAMCEKTRLNILNG